ncbi:hypothetical protein AURDEDRAFT_183524 [Auricularia subglabra TFB-10046 SS5]|nr:hypothetical protein AURDEDRAFT_183524 [Auricularia subglabra TFB-10046 SS5]
MKGLAICNSTLLRDTHSGLARPADRRAALSSIAIQTMADAREAAKPPAKRRKTKSYVDSTTDIFHYIAYLPWRDGHVYELDGYSAGPVRVASLIPGISWMDVVRAPLQAKMARLGGIRTNMLALVRGKYEQASDAMELLKRRKTALERRMGDCFAQMVDPIVRATSGPAFSSPYKPYTQPGATFSKSFGAQAMEVQRAVLDLPEEDLPNAWERCVEDAFETKKRLEELVARDKQAQAEHLRRTHDYQPFISAFIRSLAEEGLLGDVLDGAAGKNGNSENGTTKKGAAHATTDPSVPNREVSSHSPNPTPAPAVTNQDILQAVEEPPPYTPRPDLRTGEATVEYGPARPFQAAPPPPQRGAQGGWPPPPHHPQQQYRPPAPPQRWASNAGYPGAMRRDQIPGGWPPAQQQWAPPPAGGAGLGPRPSIYGVFRDGVPARGSQMPPSPSRTDPQPPPPLRSAKDAPAPGSAPSELDGEDARPTTSPVPGHPFLRNGQILVYPSSVECHKCMNTGYKNFDPHHPCRGCWEKYGKPYTGAITYAPFSSAGSSHSQISLQRPLPRQSPPGPPAPASAPATVHGHMPGAYPPPRPWGVPAPPPGATVVQPGDPRIGGRLCYRCMGEGTISVFIFDTAQCPACGGLGRILG